MLKRVLAILVVLVCALNVVACAPKNDEAGGRPNAGGTANKPGEIGGTVRYWTWADPQTIQMYNAELSKTLYKEYPNLKVNFEIATGDYYQKLLTWMSSGTEPDVFQMEPGEVYSFLKYDRIEPLDDYISKSDKLKMEDLWDINKQAYTYDGTNIGKGKLHVLVRDWSPDYMMVYNKKHFKEAGITKMPTVEDPFTWAEFEDAVTKLTKKDAKGSITRYGTLLDANPWKLMVQFINSNGGSWFDKDGNITLSDSKTKEAIDYYTRLVKKSGTDGYSGASMGAQLFANDGVSMYFTYLYALGQYNLPDKIDLGIATPPVAKAGDKPSVLTSGLVGLAISSKSNNKDSAWKFVEWSMTHLQEVQAKQNLNIPGNKAICDKYFSSPENPKFTQVNKDFLTAASSYTSIIPINKFCPQMDFENKMGNLATGYVKGGMKFDEFITRTQKEIQNIVDINKKKK